MELLKSLGIDSTLWSHLACFLVAYLALSTLVFRPYLRAFQEREKRTLGNEEDAVRLIAEAHELSQAYALRAKAMNAQIKEIYEAHWTEAAREFERAVGEARAEAGAVLAAARERIGGEILAVRRALLADMPTVSAAISTKLAGKELI